MAADRHFEISAKACFHVLFGDKSFVFPKLYFERRAQQIAQGPWVLVDQGRMRRDFHFKVDYMDMLETSKEMRRLSAEGKLTGAISGASAAPRTNTAGEPRYNPTARIDPETSERR